MGPRLFGAKLIIGGTQGHPAHFIIVLGGRRIHSEASTDATERLAGALTGEAAFMRET